MDKTKIFPDGIRFELPNDVTKEKAPWIKGKISIKVPEFILFLEKHQSNAGWVNLDLKKSDNTGKFYLELNSWKPSTQTSPLEVKEPIIDPMNGRDVSEPKF